MGARGANAELPFQQPASVLQRRASSFDQRPGWAARLVLMLGQGPTSVKPLACTSRRFACCLLRDALQLVSLLRPTALALARIDMWGECEERELSSLRDTTCMLVALADLSASSAVVSSGIASARAAEADLALTRVRLQRVGCLLSKLAGDVQRCRDDFGDDVCVTHV